MIKRVHEPEFGFGLDVRAVPYAYRCPLCHAGSARPFRCTRCDVRSVTAEQAQAWRGQP